MVLALWLAPFAAAASAQAARTWRRDPGGRRPVPPAAFAAAAVAVLGAPFGLYPFVGACLVGAVGSAMWSTSVATRRAGDAASGADVVLTLVCAAVPVAAVAGPVLLRSHGLTAALVLLVYALVYDAAAWVVGTDARYA
ncbi:MAG TPA: hypothetical protein VGI06_09660, partial [Acidimicrobiales bacterium]